MSQEAENHASGDVSFRSLFSFVRFIHSIAPNRLFISIWLVSLGILAAVLEFFGITLIIVLLQLVAGGDESSLQSDGPLGHAIVVVKQYLGDSNFAIALIVFGMICFQSFLQAAYRILTERVGQRLSEEIRHRLHWILLNIDYYDFLRHDRGELLDVLATQSFTVSAAYNGLIRLVINVGALMVFVFFLLAASWQIAVMSFVGFIALAIVLRQLSKHGRSLAVEKVFLGQQMSTVMLRTLQGMRTLRSFAKERHQQTKLEDISGAQTQVLLRQSFVQNMIVPVAEIGSVGLLLVIVLVAPKLGISFAVTLTSVALLYRIQPRMRELDWLLFELDNLKSSLARVAKFLAPEIDHTISQEEKSNLADADIEFRNVSVLYTSRNKPVLENVSFKINHGEHVAIFGPSGVGKTTIANMILRLKEPDAGVIMHGKVPLAQIDRHSWLETVAIAGQDVELVDGTLRENLLLAKQDATDDEIHTAIEVAELGALVGELPEGLDTWIGDYGQQVSGGQRQRIGIARAFLRKPSLLILDEATSALEEGLELKIIARLRKEQAGRSLVIITHNQKLIGDFDRVLLMKDGRIQRHIA